MDANDKRNAHSPQEWSYILRSGLAGGIAGCAAKTAIAPLDRVKILFQTAHPAYASFSGSFAGVFRAGRAIYGEGGVSGLLQGHSATLARVFPYAAIRFMAYDRVHFLLMPTRELETNKRRFAAGAIAGTTSVFFTYPLELIRVRMAFQTRQAAPTLPPSSIRVPPSASPAPSTASSSSTHASTATSSSSFRPSIRQAIRQIYNEGHLPASPSPSGSPSPSSAARTLFQRFPLLKFYRGFTVTLVGMVPYAGTGFLAWGWLKSRYPSRDHNTARSLAIGAVSGALAQTASYPFEVVRRRMQVGGVLRPGGWLRWPETISTIYRTAGWRGFYVGLGIGYVKVVPMTAISFAVWEAGKGVLGV